MSLIAHHQALLAAAAGDLTTWNPAHLSAPATLAAGNRELRATAVGSIYANSRSASPIVGNAYFSVRCEKGAAHNYGIGVADAGVNLALESAWPGSGNSVGWWYEGRVWHQGVNIFNASAMLNMDVQIAVRSATRRVWIRRAGGGWIGGGNPAADTSPTATLAGSGALYVAASINPGSSITNALIRLPVTAAGVTGTPPDGFTVGVF